MTATPPRPGPVGYRIQVAGRLDAHWSPWFDDLTLTDESDGTTSISAAVADQTQLHGLLAKIRDLGIPLISVQRIPDAGIDHSRGVRPIRGETHAIEADPGQSRVDAEIRTV